MSFYIGVDGGGTKTYYALFDEKKNIIADFKTAGSNHENLGGSFDEAADILWDGVHGLLEKAGKTLEDVDFSLMGLAGVDHPFQHDAIYSRLETKGLRRFEIFNDGFIVVKAGSISGAAIGLNNGTGTCCNAVDSTGRMLQLAGLGDYSGDMGNGRLLAFHGPDTHFARRHRHNWHGRGWSHPGSVPLDKDDCHANKQRGTPADSSDEQRFTAS